MCEANIEVALNLVDEICRGLGYITYGHIAISTPDLKIHSRGSFLGKESEDWILTRHQKMHWALEGTKLAFGLAIDNTYKPNQPGLNPVVNYACKGTSTRYLWANYCVATGLYGSDKSLDAVLSAILAYETMGGDLFLEESSQALPTGITEVKLRSTDPEDLIRRLRLSASGLIIHRSQSLEFRNRHNAKILITAMKVDETNTAKS